MRLFVNKFTAHRALRLIRANGRAIPVERLDLARSDPSPHRHWSARLVPRERLALDELRGTGGTVSIAVPSKGARVRAARSEGGGDARGRGADARRTTESLAAALRERYVNDLRRNREFAALRQMTVWEEEIAF